MSTPFLKPATDSCTKAAGGTSELLIVEGKSAAEALDQVRDRRYQGIFIMQGKIPNAETVTAQRLKQHKQCAALMDLLSEVPGKDKKNHYDHVVIAPDADVDGRHCAILLIALFRMYLGDWVTARRLHLFRTPLARIGHLQLQSDNAKVTGRYLNTAAEVQLWLSRHSTEATNTANSAGSQLTHFKGLAAFNSPELANLVAYPVHSNDRSLCLTPAATIPT